MGTIKNILDLKYNKEKRLWTPIYMALSNMWPDIVGLDIHNVERITLRADGTVSIQVPKGTNVYLVKFVGYSPKPKNAVVDDVGLEAMKRSGNTILKAARILG